MSSYRRQALADKLKGKRARINDIVTRAAIQTSLVRDQLDVEHKHVEFNFPGTTLGTAGSIFYLTAIAEGDDVGNRIGRKVNLLSSYLTGRVKFSASANGQSGTCRIMIVRDKVSNGVAPTFSDVLQYPLYVNSPYTIEKVGSRFEIITNILYNLSFLDNTFVVEHFAKLKDGAIAFSATTSLIAGAVSGHLYFFGICEFHPSSTQSVSFNGSWRGVFTDA